MTVNSRVAFTGEQQRMPAAANHVDRACWQIEDGNDGVIAAAIHNGHRVRPELLPLFAVDDATRRREEDPYTTAWTPVAQSRIVGRRSRFEVDLNRPPERAVYRRPEDAWGLSVWHRPLPAPMAARSLAQHTAFYTAVEAFLKQTVERCGCFVVLDLHSYNHRRGGPDAEPDDPAGNPDINVGTGSMDRAYWGRLVDRFIADLRGANFPGRELDVRENVKFRGGYFPQFIHERFPNRGCAIAVEVKKFFMDEWTGRLNVPLHVGVFSALARTVPGLRESLRAMHAPRRVNAGRRA
jgi:hypothetical protein